LAVVVEQTGERALASIVWLGTRALLFLGLLYGLTRLRRLYLRVKSQPPAGAAPPLAWLNPPDASTAIPDKPTHAKPLPH
jgi:hypothetical protein